MGMLLAFSPFVFFAVLSKLVGTEAGLLAGAIVAALLLARDRMRGKQAKVLELGTVALFAVLAGWVAIAGSGVWSIVAVRFAVDGGLFLIVLLSLAIRQPFTLQYAREQVPEHVARTPQFLRVNDIITAVWAIAFAVFVAADAVMTWLPQWPLWIGIAASVLAFAGAVKFTVWYPARLRAAMAARRA
jgi:hypothetical protein